MFRNPMPIYKQFIILEFLGNATLQEEEKEKFCAADAKFGLVELG